MSKAAPRFPAGVVFPHLVARDLEGRSRVLPQDFAGDANLVIVAFRREQQAMVDTWVEWFETAAATHPGLRCYEVPVLSRRWRPARSLIDGGMARAVRGKEARRRTLTVYTDVGAVTDALAIADTHIVTVLLIDSRGRVGWRTTGPATQSARSELAAALTGNAKHAE